jgi:hypothetical protein
MSPICTAASGFSRLWLPECERVNLSFTGRASPFNGLDQAFMELNRSLASPSAAREGASKMLRRNND